MATLRLKKRLSTEIATMELPAMAGKFAVARQLPDFKSVRFTVCHDSLEAANAEAARLYAENSKYRYLVMQIVGTVGN